MHSGVEAKLLDSTNSSISAFSGESYFARAAANCAATSAVQGGWPTLSGWRAYQHQKKSRGWPHPFRVLCERVGRAFELRHGRRKSLAYLHKAFRCHLPKGKKWRLVGAIGFEPTTPCAQGRCATRLRYAPTRSAGLILKYFPTLFPLPLLISGLDRAQTAHLFAYCTMTVRIRSPVVGAISLARRLSFSKASRFICNFIWEYFLKTCASPWRSICVTHSSATPPALSHVA